MRRILLLPLLMLAFLGVAKTQENASDEAIKKEILQVEEVQDRAIQQNDADTLNRIYAPDFAYVNQYGILIPRDQVLAGFRTAKSKFLAPMKHDDILIISGLIVAGRERYPWNGVRVNRDAGAGRDARPR